MPRKNLLCLTLSCILVAGIIAIPGQFVFTADLQNKSVVTTYANDAQSISDYFYMQIYNIENQIISKYKVTLTGTVSKTRREITSVSFSCVSGDTCTTEYDIDGNTAYVKITHPIEGELERIFSLSTSGVFSVF